MLLIATDEAGYGPKLGPLVISGTVWKIPGEDFGADELTARLAPLRTPTACGDVTVLVDDSKAVFKPSAGLKSLHTVVSACLHWCRRSEETFRDVLPKLAPHDAASIARAPWLGLESTRRFVSRSVTSELLRQWRSSGIELADVQARIITAEAFNAICEGGCNKADLLSQSTLELVKRLVDLHAGDESTIAVYCDRHGGRRYYAGVLQHVFPEAALQVVVETKNHSAYRLKAEEATIDVHFTVKGDSFTPVALSSMHAKYLRERLMESLNAYFAELHGDQPPPLKSTAGYPVDADRFLRDIAPILARENIDLRKLVRSR